MAETKRPLKVFLCHASADKPAVRDLYKRLTADGIDAWLDAENLIAGQNWQIEIPKAIRESDVVVVCLSEQSISKEGYVQKELRFALDIADEKPQGTIFIIPARLEECIVPNRLSDYHWVDLFEENGYERLMRALRTRADKIGATLQIKNNWLPKINTQIIDNKKTVDKQETNNLRKQIRNAPTIFGYFVIIFIAFIFVLIFGVPALIGEPESTHTATSTETLKTFTPPPASKTSTITITPEIIITNTIAPLPTKITDTKGVPMALVLEGKFTMGSVDNFANEKPVRLVYLNSYYIDKYEVSNRNYNLCVQNGECLPPKKRSSKTHISYFGNPDFDNYPVIYVTWEMAQTYCQWREARLPTEAEWEKAARGADGRIYPWGDTIENMQANYNGLVGDLDVVGKHHLGVSLYGLFDMAGNAQEWVNDWYQADYYSLMLIDVRNPLGPFAGEERVIRGGSWDGGKNFIRTTYRFKSSPSVSFYNISFRCAKDVDP